jgi:spermidine synthase
MEGSRRWLDGEITRDPSPALLNPPTHTHTHTHTHTGTRAGKGLRGLILGGGDGGVATRLLIHPEVSSLILCEIDEVRSRMRPSAV